MIGTEGTVKGGAYLRAIHARAADAHVVQQACPLFVPLAEEGLIEGEIAELAAERYLKPVFADAKPAALVLGCTHFPVLAPMLEKVIARLGGAYEARRQRGDNGGCRVGASREERSRAERGSEAVATFSSPPMRRSVSRAWAKSSSAAHPITSSWWICRQLEHPAILPRKAGEGYAKRWRGPPPSRDFVARHLPAVAWQE